MIEQIVANDILEEKQLEEEVSFEPVYLDPSKVTFKHEGENLSFTLLEGKFYSRITLRRCFPFTSSSGDDIYLTVRTPDTEDDAGGEIGILPGINQLEPESLAAVLGELKLHYFVPVIKKIFSIREEYGFLYWNVNTDRGEIEFIMRDNVVAATRQISDMRWLIIDINQARYEVSDDGTLDSRSRKLLSKYLLL